jgi:hypothetical protein
MGLPRPDASTPVHDYLAQHWSRMVILNWPWVKRAMVWCEPARSPSWQDSGMERVIGIGGYFMRAADPAALGAWYRDCLGLDADENGLWRQGAGLTVFATFESGTGYFGSGAQQAMLNFRVRDLDAMLAQLRAKGSGRDSRDAGHEGCRPVRLGHRS